MGQFRNDGNGLERALVEFEKALLEFADRLTLQWNAQQIDTHPATTIIQQDTSPASEIEAVIRELLQVFSVTLHEIVEDLHNKIQKDLRETFIWDRRF